MQQKEQFDRIVGIGCSFTQGGGLNNDISYKYYNGIDSSIELHEESRTLDEFMYQNSYVAHLSYLLQIPYENLSESRSSNELILNKVYNRFKDNSERVLLILQPSFFSRMSLYSVESLRHEKLSGQYINQDDVSIDLVSSEDISNNIVNLYKDYLKYSHDTHVVEDLFYEKLDVYSTWLESKNVTSIILPWNKFNNVKRKNIVTLDGMDLSHYVEYNKMRFSDVPHLNFNDSHISLEGNEKLANKLYEYIKNEL